MVKQFGLFVLLLAFLLLPAWAAAAAFPDTAACCKAEDTTPIAPEQCTMTLPLQDGENTQIFSRAENQACLLLKRKDEQPAGEAVTLKSEENVILTASPKAPFKTLIVSTPALQEGQTLTVWQSDALVCQRVINGSLKQFPVTPSKRTKASRHGGNGAAAAEPPAKAAASGSMTACPASPASSELGYWLYTSAGAKQEKLPLIVYLHGGSGKGSDLQRITDMDGFSQYVQAGRLGDLHTYVLCPQCPEEQSGWRDIADPLLPGSARIP